MMNVYSHHAIQPLQIIDSPVIWSGAIREHRCNFFTKLILDIGVGSNEIESLVKEVIKQEERKEESTDPSQTARCCLMSSGEERQLPQEVTICSR
jgi:hypothetical protein